LGCGHCADVRVVVTEKPSVARDIARVLGVKTAKTGYYEGNDYQISWALGHLVEMLQPDAYGTQYKAWRMATLPIIPEEFQYGLIQNDGAKTQYHVIEQLLKQPNIESVICATDAGREGELIFRLIYETAGCQYPIQRLWISSQTEAAIRQGFAQLKSGDAYAALYDSALSRAQADWLVGINATRAFTIKYAKGQGVMSVGRVQTPVLKMIVDRFRANQAFESQSFYEVFITAQVEQGSFKAKWADAKTDRLTTSAAAETIAAAVKADPQGRIANLTKKTKQEQVPLLYDLTELQREANRKFKFSADHTLQLAQALYERHKVLSYPRTSSRYLSQDVAKTIPSLLAGIPDAYQESLTYIREHSRSLADRLIDDSKISDHHAIIPTEKPAVLAQLSSEEASIYDLVIRRFLAAFYPVCVKHQTDVTVLVAAHSFKATGMVVHDLGWRALYPELDSMDKAIVLPRIETNESVLAKTPTVKVGKTKAPPLHTESSILGLMETAGNDSDDESVREALKQCGLGTPATRAQILEKLIHVQYIQRQKNKLIPTDKGEYIIDRLGDHVLTSPELTGQWEKRLNDMAASQYLRKDYMEEIEAFTQDIIDSVVAMPADDQKPEGEVFGPCPVTDCGGHIVETPKAYSCSKWKETGCSAVIWKVMSEKEIKKTQVKQLLKDGKTSVIKGFKSKTGDTFDASLTLVDGRVQLVYGEPLGPCPVCDKGQVVETPKAYGCSTWKDTGCPMAIWKQVAKRSITSDEAKALVTSGKTNVLDGFTSRAGKSFSAALVLNGGKVEFKFD
jgi:DNA topoisomerase-3